MNMKEHEDLIAKVEKAKDQIAQLRKQQSELEREKTELEDLRSKQEEWYRGRREVGDWLLKGAAVLDGEEADLNKMIALARSTKESFAQHLEALSAIKEDDWTPVSLKDELSKALIVLQKARRDYGVARGRIPALEGKEAGAKTAPDERPAPGPPELRDAKELMRLGFWLALPAALMAIIILIVYACL